MEDSEINLFYGFIRNNRRLNMRAITDKIISIIREEGLTVRQARNILNDLLDDMDEYSIILTAKDYEKLTGEEYDIYKMDNEGANTTKKSPIRDNSDNSPPKKKPTR